MAKASAINLNDVFLPSPHSRGATSRSSHEEALLTLPNPAGPGPGSISAASAHLAGQVAAASTAKERSSSAGSRRQTGLSHPGVLLPSPPLPEHLADGPLGGQHNARLPPLMHGHTVPGLPGSYAGPGGTSPLPGRPATWSAPPETLQPLLQQPTMLPGPVPAAHPYQPKRKPPSAFMRHNPVRHQLEQHPQHPQHPPHLQHPQHPHGGARPFLAFGSASSHDAEGLLPYNPQYGIPQGLLTPDDAAAEAAAAPQGPGQPGGPEERAEAGPVADGGAAGAPTAAAAAPPPPPPRAAAYSAAPPWGVSSVSDLEALDSILDQLVVVDARMRKALLNGPLISFETVVPEHALRGAGVRGGGGRRAGGEGGEEERDRTFLTAVKGIAEEGDAGAEEEPAAEAVPEPAPEPAQDDAAVAAAAAAATAAAAARSHYAAAEEPDPLLTSIFKAAIPNPGMHPSFTRAYLASKVAPRPQHLPPPPPATAENLLRSRPPPFIAAPSYDQLCSQIRDVQRQYTCGTASRPSQSGNTVVAGIAGVAAGPVPVPLAPAGAAPAAAGPHVSSPPAGAGATQYISGLDGPMLEDLVAHQDLPISLERVRPTFVALKQKASRSGSPRRRAVSAGRPGAAEGHLGGVPVGGGGGVTGHRL